jgi:hypothetical protein
LLPNVFFRFGNGRIEGFVLDAGRPNNLFGFRIVFPQADEAAPIKNRMIRKFGKADGLLQGGIFFIDEALDVVSQ